MQMIRAIPVTPSILTSSNVVEAAPAAYNGATSYSIGDQAAVLTGTTAALYESLVNGNMGNSPALSPSAWKPIGSTYATYSGGTSYNLADRVISTTTHKVYESLVAANLGNALTDATKWLEVGPTNKWAMFDSINGTATSHPTVINITLAMPSRFDAIALVSMENVATVQVIVTTVADGEIYNETFATISTVGIVDWYSYFFEDIIQKDALLIPGLPAYYAPTVQIIITGTGTADMAVGTFVIGRTKYLGATLRDGARVGTRDFSRKDTDDFGNLILVERPYAKTAAFRLSMPHGMVDDVHKTLGEYRATPTIYSGSDDFSSTLIFGFYKDFSIGFEYPLLSYCSIEIEGLT